MIELIAVLIGSSFLISEVLRLLDHDLLIVPDLVDGKAVIFTDKFY